MDDAEWDAMLAQAEEHHVAAWLAACLRDRCSPARQGHLEAIARSSAKAAFYWSCELKNLLGVFAQHEISVVPLKGPFLAERLYGSTALRVCRDLDLLVRTDDTDRAEAVLADCGFVPDTPDDYHRAWSRRGTIVELHYDVENPLAFDFVISGALRHTQTASFQEAACRQLAPEDELLYLCLHAARHRYDRLSLVVDLRLAFEKLICSAQQWTPREEVRPLNGLVVLGIAMVGRLDPGFETGLQVDVSPSYRTHLEGLADRLWCQLTTQVRKPLTWRTVHSFFLETEEPGWARLRCRLRHMRILSRRVIDADSEFAAKFGLSRGWQARLLRPVRLLSGALCERRTGNPTKQTADTNEGL